MKNTSLIYLFNYETLIESEVFGLKKRKKAIQFLNRVQKAQKEGRLSKEKEPFNELFDINRHYYCIKQTPQNEWTLDDYQWITLYRLKYAINRQNIADALGTTKAILKFRENQIVDPEIQKRISNINEYFQDKYAAIIPKKGSRK